MADEPTDNDLIIEETDTSAISYFGPDWTTRQEDGYHNGSVEFSMTTGASFSLTFIGERLWYYSDVYEQYGDFSVALDGIVVQPSLPAYRPSQKYQELLYNQTVEPGSHTLTVTDIPPPTIFALCFDYAVIRPMSSETQDANDVIVTANNSTITYTPADAWTPNLDGNFETVRQGASVSFTFEGDYVWFEGTRDTDHGAYLVSIDNGTALRFSSWGPTALPPAILYNRALSKASHTITITNVEDGKKLGIGALVYRPLPAGVPSTPVIPPPSLPSIPQPSLPPMSLPPMPAITLPPIVLTLVTTTVDGSTVTYVVTESNPSLPGSPSSSSSQDAPAQPGGSTTISSGAVAGAAVGATVTVVAIALAFFFARRRKRQDRA